MRRRVLAGVAGWLGVLGVVALAVHPEPCPPASPAEIHEAADRAVGWFGVNRLDGGRYRYRWNRDLGEPEPGYNDVRHVGVMSALYHATGAGIDGALDAADHGRAYVDEHLVETPAGPAFGRGDPVRSGSTALLVTALDQRWEATGSDRDRELLRRLGGTLAASVGPGGEVAADIDVEEGPVAGTTSPFFTGEVAWALARLHLRFPDAGFDDATLRIRRYVIEDRDRAEPRFPPLSDHWMGYALSTMATWPAAPEPPGATAAGEGWRDRQLGLLGVQVRYESQRQGGITTLTRGSDGSAAGIGTLGEGLAGHLGVPGSIEGAAREGALERLVCVAGLLEDRQDRSDDPRTSGAWFSGGVTQMDDQQHALSALLLTEALLASEPAPSGAGDEEETP